MGPSEALPPDLLETCISRLNDIVLITEAEPQDEPGPRILYVNDAFVRKTGYSREEVLGKSPRLLQGPKTSRQELDRVRAALREWKPVRAELINYTKSGAEFWLEMDIVPVAGETGWYTHWIAIERDITERKQAVEALKASAERYQLLFENSPVPMWVCDAETWAFVAVNDAAIQKYEYSREEFLSLTIRDIRPPEDIPALTHTMSGLKAGLDYSGVWRHQTKSGRNLTVEIHTHTFLFDGRPARLVMPLDISERVVLEEQLQQAQKMEIIGRMAGGVAHDFNNLLTVINGYSQILLGNAEIADNVKGVVRNILKAGERAAEFTSRLLAFSRKQVLEPKIINIASSLESMKPMLERLIPEDVEIVWQLADTKNLVSFDPARFEQVILNLAINGRDAMPGGGSLTIETGTAYLDESYKRFHPDVDLGDYALVRVKDSGYGMSTETMKHIFEPFFTTKAKGSGTGLGLATAYGIVKQSGGHISASSQVGVGSQFAVYLPIADGETSHIEQKEISMDELKGTETILVVEDDADVRQYASAILRQMGYQVFEARSGPEAILESEKHLGSVDLLLTDIVMPRMHGQDLAEFLLEQRSTMRVLFMSGYNDEALAQHGIPDKGKNFLAKPFSSLELLQKVRSVLAPSKRSKTILILDDEEGIRHLFRDALDAAGYATVCCDTGKAAMAELEEHPFDLLITDLVMPDQEGIETIRLVRKVPQVKILAMSGYGGGEYLHVARLLGAKDTLPKPVDLKTLRDKVAALIGH
jgi:PAS domain S-box-containing protein